MTTQLLIWLPLALLVFAAFWSGVVYLTAQISGWAQLARQYRNDGPFTGQLWRWETGAMRSIGFRACLTIGANRAGLYLAMQPLFHMGHPPLFIPWKHITAQPKKYFFQKGTEFQLGPVPLWIREETTEKLRAASR